MQNLGDNVDVLTRGLVTGFSGIMSGAVTTHDPGTGRVPSISAGTVSGRVNSKSELVFATFNQDTTSLAVGTSQGYKLYSLSSTDALDPVYENATEGVYIAERLFSSSLVAIVTHSSPRTLKVCHFKKGTEICIYTYASKILAVKMNRARLVVCLEESLFIHNIRDMKVLHTIRETPPNKQGLCALSTDSAHCYLAYPGHSSVGELQIFDALNLASTSMIPAHSGQLAAIQLSPLGTRVATASDKGTVIRVFNVTDGNKLYELRRGLKRTASIYSLSFSPCGIFLACSSNTETVHIFRLEESVAAGNNDGDSVGIGGSEVVTSPTSGSGAITSSSSGDGGSWMGYLSNVVSASATYLPSQVTDTFLQGRAFATVHHQNLYGCKNICALAMMKKTLRLLLTSDDGYLYIYGMDVKEGGDCHLIRQFNLVDSAAADLEGGRSSWPSSGGDSTPHSEVVVERGDPGSGVVAGRDVRNIQTRNHDPSDMRLMLDESEKFHEMAVATESPPRHCFLLDDDGEFPPVSSAAATTSGASPGSPSST